MVAKRPALPFEEPEGILFTLKDITYTPEKPRLKEPFTVKGNVELFKIPFLAPIWVIAKVTAPETWWEHYIPIWGSPTVGEGQMAIGSDFEITFPRGFDREGEFILDVEVYAGPTYTIDKITLPPFPPMASKRTTFLVAGEVPPEEAGFRNFRILSYSKNGGPPVTPPGVLELDIGDRCRVNVGFDHRDGAVTGEFHAAIWQDRPWDPHDEILNAEKAFSVPSSADWEPREGYIDIIITSAISPGSEYGLYVKIMGITGGDIFTEYLDNVITIVGVPPEEADIKDFDFKLTKGTYELGARVPFTAPYDYKGIAQDGQLTISIGTGVYPTFNPVYTYEPIPVEFPVAGDWEHRGLEGNITLPNVLEAGQTYSVRAKLETLEIKAQETDTDWSAFDIIAGVEYRTLEIDITPIGSGWVSTSPAPLDIPNHFDHNDIGTFEYNTRVMVTAHPHSGYVFDHWSDEIRGGTSTSNPEWVSDNGYMVDNKAVKAHFREEVGKEPPDIDTLSAQNITHDSATLRAELNSEGYCGVIKCYIEWGRTTGYGNKTPERRLYPGDLMEVDIGGLEADTTYHFKAVAVGDCVAPPLIGYGSDRSFTTESEVVKGFTMRVEGYPTNANYWDCWFDNGGVSGESDYLPIGSTWNYEGEVSTSKVDISFACYEGRGGAYLKYGRFQYVFRLYSGKRYVYNFAEHEFYEE